MSLKDCAIERFGYKAFSMRPSFYNHEGALRFELGVGDDNLSYMSNAVYRFNALLDDLGFKDQLVGIASYIYTYEPNDIEQVDPLYQQLLPFARNLANKGFGKFDKTNFIQIPNDEHSSCSFHFSTTSLNELGVAQSIMEHLLRDFGGSNDTPLLMFFNIELGIIINPYDNRGMDVFGPNRDFLRKLYHKRYEWLLDYDRQRMDAQYRD